MQEQPRADAVRVAQPSRIVRIVGGRDGRRRAAAHRKRAPAATIGNDGTVYLDTTTGLFYGPKTAGAWPPPVPTPPPAAVAEGANNAAVTLDAGTSPAFGAPVTVWTMTGLAAGDHLLDAAVVAQPNALSVTATIQC